MSLSPEELRELARYVLLTRPGEIGCDDWLGHAPRYAELVAAGRSVPEPLRRGARKPPRWPGGGGEVPQPLLPRPAAELLPLAGEGPVGVVVLLVGVVRADHRRRVHQHPEGGVA